MKGPGIFLAQFLRDRPPYDRLETIARWVAGLGYTVEIDGHDFADIHQAVQACRAVRGEPSVIVARALLTRRSKRG